MIESVQYFFSNYSSYFRIQDFIDILIISYLIYKAFCFIRETRAEQLIKGIIVLVVMLLFSELLGLYAMNYVLKNMMQVGVIAILIVFQPELRRLLESMGRSRFGHMFATTEDVTNRETEQICDMVCTAVADLSAKRIGALIVFERETKTGDIIRTGTLLESLVSVELIGNLFVANTPLHDGAIIIRGKRIMAAGCLLPLTQANRISSELGTRHRAAIGMSENSDAAIVVVSEETGKISIALDGSLTRNLNVDTLRKALVKILLNENESKPINKMFKRNK